MKDEDMEVDEMLLVECAESFQKIGELFIDEIGQRYPEGATQKPPPGLGDLVCCATNLSFSLELCLKALLVKSGEAYPHQHDLLALYKMLPAKDKHSIELDYNRYLKSIPPGLRGSITIAKGPVSPPKWRDYAEMKKDLASVLYRSRDVFSSWRYLFEVKLEDEESYEIHEFEYRLLHCAYNALLAQLKPEADEPGV